MYCYVSHNKSFMFISVFGPVHLTMTEIKAS